MCKLLNVSRKMIYYKYKDDTKKVDSDLENTIIKIFNKSYRSYGTRRIKICLNELNIKSSRKKIGYIMNKYNLVSNYTIKYYKVHKNKCNNEIKENIIKRNFNSKTRLNSIVSDLTYVKVGSKWTYICILIDLFNREIIGYSVGNKKDSELVLKAFRSIKYSINRINILHTDRGLEFKNKKLDEFMKVFNIEHSLSYKGCPYDNAVAEATYKIIKTEFIFNKSFKNIEELELKFSDYVNWYNNFRIHNSLGNLSPIQFLNKNIA